jgi:hypothetical protein
LAKHKALKTQRFDFRTAGKKAMLREIFPCALLCALKKRKKSRPLFLRARLPGPFRYFDPLKNTVFPVLKINKNPGTKLTPLPQPATF